MIVLGLTGSIGMGKSTTAAMFRDENIPVHDADQAVHRIYSGVAAPMIEEAFPGTVVDGTVDREKLAAKVLGNTDALQRLERIVHPLVRADADAFVENARKAGEPLVVLDIPLLFETGGDAAMDQRQIGGEPLARVSTEAFEVFRRKGHETYSRHRRRPSRAMTS